MTARWWYSKGEAQCGPFTSEELKRLAAGGELDPADSVWREGESDRWPAASIKGLFDPHRAMPDTGARSARLAAWKAMVGLVALVVGVVWFFQAIRTAGERETIAQAQWRNDCVAGTSKKSAARARCVSQYPWRLSEGKDELTDKPWVIADATTMDAMTQDYRMFLDPSIELRCVDGTFDVLVRWNDIDVDHIFRSHALVAYRFDRGEAVERKWPLKSEASTVITRIPEAERASFLEGMSKAITVTVRTKRHDGVATTEEIVVTGAAKAIAMVYEPCRARASN